MSKSHHFLPERLIRLLGKDVKSDSLPSINIFIGKMDSVVLNDVQLFSVLLIARPFSLKNDSLLILSNLKDNMKMDIIPQYRTFSFGNFDVGIMGVLSEQFPVADVPESIFKSENIREIKETDFRILLAYITEGELRNILKKKPPFDLIIWKPIFNQRRSDWIQDDILIVSTGNGLPYLTRLSIRIPEKRPYHFVNLNSLEDDINRIKIRLNELSDGKFRSLKPDQWAENEQDYREAMELENQLKILSREILEIPCAYSKTLIPIFRISGGKVELGIGE